MRRNGRDFLLKAQPFFAYFFGIIGISRRKRDEG